MPRHSRTGGIAIAHCERDAEIFELKAMGWTLEEIGDHVNLNGSTIHRIIDARLKADKSEQVATYRQAQWLKYQAMESSLQEQAYGYRAMLDEHGKPVMEPLLDRDMHIICNPAGQPLMRPRRDTEANDRGKALILKIWSDLTKLLGTAAPVRTETMTFESAAPPEPLTFNVRDGGARHPAFARLTQAELDEVLKFIVDNGFAQAPAPSGTRTAVPMVTYAP